MDFQLVSDFEPTGDQPNAIKELVEGVDELLINLNPSETRSFRYLASTKVPGQYKIHLRDLSYRDFEGNKYISSFSDDFSIVVKSNIEKQFQFELANAIEDFTIDNFEKQKLDLRKEQLREIYKNNDEIDIDDEKIEVQEGESLEDIKAKLKPKKSAISAEMLDTANTYDDKVAVIRMIVGDEAGRVSSVFKGMMGNDARDS